MTAPQTFFFLMKETSEVNPSSTHTKQLFEPFEVHHCCTKQIFFFSFLLLSDWLNPFAAKLFLEGTASAAQIVLAGKGLKRLRRIKTAH